MGKRDLQKLLLHTAWDMRGMKELSGFDLRTYLWSDRVTEYNDGDRITARGAASEKALSSFLDRLSGRPRVLLMSDGLFTSGSESAMILLKKKCDLLLTLAVGADADIDALSLISSDQLPAYSPEQIMTAVRTLCFAEART